VRRRLLGITVAATALVVVAFVVPLAGLVRSVARDRAVSVAERDMASMAPALASTDDTSVLFSAVADTATGQDGRLTVWLPDGSRVGDESPADTDALALAQREAFSQHDGDGLVLYTPVVTEAGNTSVVRARLPSSLLERGVARSWAALAGVGLALVAAAGLIADRLGRSLTREATALAGTARTLAAGDPEARVVPGRTPELADAARALNLLADRIDELRSAERARVADLSHRLRTPLTALRLDAEAAGDADLVADVDRMEASVTELIRAAQRPLHEGAVRSRADVTAVVRERAAFWGALADDDGRPWTLDVDAEVAAAGPVEVEVGVDELGAALDALLDNVFNHTPEGTSYAVSLALVDGGGMAQVRVDDAGPGIADGAAVLARGETRGRAHSTGLGLDIAHQTAESAGGDLTLTPSPRGGTCATLTLPVVGVTGSA